MKRVITIIFAAAVSLLAVLIPTLVCTLVWIIATESGTQFGWQHARAFLPDTMVVNSLEGRLAGPLEVRGVRIKTETFHLELDRIKLEWLPSALFRRLLDVESIELEGLRYAMLKPAPPKPEVESASINLPEEIVLLLDVRLGNVLLRDFQFRSQPDTEPFRIDSAMLTAFANRHRVEISNLKVDSPLFAVEGNTSLTTDRNYLLHGELHWRVPVPDYPVVHGHTVLDGSLRELTIKQNIAKPYAIHAVVLLKDPLSNLSFDATLDVKPLQLQALNAELPPMTVQLAVTGKGDPSDIVFNVNGWAEDLDLGRVNGAVIGRLKSQKLTIDELKISTPEQPGQMTAGGQIDMAGELTFNLTADWQQLQWPLKGTPLISSPRGTIQLTGTPENLHAGLDIEIGNTGKIEGKVDRENEDIDIALDWHDLQWPLQQPQIKSPNGHVAVAGNIDDYLLDIRAKLVVPEQTDALLMVTGQGGRETLELSHVEVSVLQGKIEGRAGISWKPELKGDVDLVGRGLNPGLILQGWPGKLGIALRAQGGIKGDQPSLQLQQLNVQGQLRGYELSLDATGAHEGNLTILERLALSSGSTRFEADGTISDTLDVTWQVHSDDLGTLLPNAKGRIDGKGTLAGPAKRPQVATELTAEEVVYSDYRLKSLNLNANVDVTGKNQSRVSLTLQDGHAAGIELRKITLNGRGDPGMHTFTLAADTSSGQTDIVIQGELQYPWQQNMVWNFRLDQAKLKYPDLDGWVLQTPSTGRIAAGQAQLSQSCWQSGEALLCLTGQQANEEIQASFSLTDLPFSYFAHYLPPDIDAQGSLSGNGAFSQSKSKSPSATIDFNTTRVRLLSRDSSDEQQQDALIVELQPGDIHLQMQQDELQASVKLPLSETDGLELQATISSGQDPLLERPLQGQITTEIENLDFIADLIPEVQDLTGRLKGRIALAGSIESPVLSGRLALVEGGAKLEGPGLDLKDIQVLLTGEGDRGVQLTAHALSEGGELNIDGTADLRGGATRADIKVKGENFRLINTFETQVDASPDLTIALREKRIDVGGEVVIPSAQIKLKTLPELAIKISGDQVIIESEEKEETSNMPGREMHARVRIILGDKVRFEGFGLNARIEGNILAVEKPGEPTTASGKLMILDGEYRAYGQGLVIEKGHILFAGGPINQPGLDVRAVRRPEKNITVGVQVRGNLRQPDFTLFSDPTMTQGNQLSYLVLGRHLSGTSSDEGSALSRASLALGLKGGNSVAEKIGSKLGLDQFGVDSGEAGSNTNPEQASFVVGKYLSPKLYVSYGLGLFNPISTLRLQYAISSRWALVTESSGAASGGDIIYTIEAGK